MKKYVLVLLILLLVLCLCRCFFRSEEYEFQNTLDMVVSVELLYNHNESPSGYDTFDFTLIRELEPEEIITFMNDIYQLETSRGGGTPPRWGYGWYIAKVVYSNGDVEMLGSYNIEYIACGEDQTGVGIYYFADDAFEEVFSKYVDISQYPKKNN